MKIQRFIPLLVIAAGLLAYHNSFTGPFIFDDVGSIPENPTIRRLWPIWQPLSPPHQGGLTVEGRPIINFSLALSYALSGYQVWGYHALNLTVHILAGLTLFGVVRRTLLQPRLRERFGAVADVLALAVAVIWTVHPLQTESVTYIIQRAESIMGLFYLLTMYFFIRGAESPIVPKARLWFGLCVTTCAFGMASKEVMASAPLMVLLYDRAFVSGSFGEAWRRRRPLYLGLAATWVLLGALLIFAGSLSNALANAKASGLDKWGYLATQPGVILHYLRMSVWPDPLCFDYFGWPIAKTWMSILPSTLAIAILLGITAWGWKNNSAWWFLGAWFFLILAPSSSFIPLDSPAFEHRLYLSSAAVVCLVVLGLYSLLGPRSLAVFAVIAIGLGFLTWRRNQDYRSEIAIWQDTIIKRPSNPRAHNNLGLALLQTGAPLDAIGHCEQALAIKPDYADAHNNLALALWRIGKRQEALEHYERALEIKPEFATAQYNLGVALLQMGKMQDAIEHLEAALRTTPNLAGAHNNLGVALLKTGKTTPAIVHLEQAVRIKPDYTAAHYNLGVALEQVGRVPGAMGQYEEVLRIEPGFVDTRNKLALLQARQAQLRGAQ